MHLFRPALLALSSLLLSASIAAQPPPRDPQAVVILQQALAAMGRTAPTDSVATGTAVLVAGSTTETGTIRILTRRLDQSAEYFQTPAESRVVIYSRGHADEREGTSVKPLSMELAATSQSPDFPLPLLAGALNSPETALQYLGPETLDGSAVHHIRFWSTFSSQPKFRHLAEFSQRDLWLDVASGLPHKLAYDRRAAGGSAARIPAAVFYSD